MCSSPEGSYRKIVLGAEVGALTGRSGTTKILYPHCLEELRARPQDSVSVYTQQIFLPYLEPRLQVEELQSLEEVSEEIHWTKLHQEVEELMDSRVLDLPYVVISSPIMTGPWYLKRTMASSRSGR